jgi:hypothetical protein
VTDSPNSRDESRNRRREEALARRVGDALDQLAHRNAVECPDAEVIAAYHEKSLEPDEIARCESHFATCARCRKVLLVLAASVDAPLDETEVARLGTLVAAARSPLQGTTHTDDHAHQIRLSWRTRWLAPAMGIAAVLAIWFAMRPPRRANDQNPPGNLIAQAPASAPAPSIEMQAKQQSAEATGTPRKNTEADAEALKNMAPDRIQSANPPADSLAKKSLDAGGVARETVPSSNAAENGLRDEKKQKADSTGGLGVGTGTPVGGALSTPAPAARAAAPSPTAPPPPLAQARTPASNQAPSDAIQPRSTTQSVTVTGEAPAVQTTNGAVSGSLNESKAKDLPLNGRNYQSMAKFDAQGEFPVQLKSPSGKILWRAGQGGNIQRSFDAGGTWTSQANPLQEDWLAGAPVSDTVCWIVGRNGTIARTTDGNHWEKVSPPPMAADSLGKLPDWIGIVAVDANTATITASDLRRFATRDAGKTWNAQ